MKHARAVTPLLLASALFTSASFAQEAAPAAEAAPVSEATVSENAVDAEAAGEAPAPATDASATTGNSESETAEPVTDVTDVAAPVAASGSLNEQVRTAIGAPKEGKAQVVFFRPSKFVGGAIKFKVREGETELGQLGSGRYFVRNLAPGAHAFTVRSEAKDVTNVELEAGETYFIAGSISMGVVAGRPNLSPSDAAAFEAALKKLKKLEVAD